MMKKVANFRDLQSACGANLRPSQSAGSSVAVNQKLSRYQLGFVPAENSWTGPLFRYLTIHLLLTNQLSGVHPEYGGIDVVSISSNVSCKGRVD